MLDGDQKVYMELFPFENTLSQPYVCFKSGFYEDQTYHGRSHLSTFTLHPVSLGEWHSTSSQTTPSRFHEAMSEVSPDDSVSQVHAPVAPPPAYSQLYSDAPTGSTGL